MTVLVIIAVWVIALLVVLLLVGGVRRGDELHARTLRSMRNPAETPRPGRYASPWAKPPKNPGRTPVDTRGRSAAGS